MAPKGKPHTPPLPPGRPPANARVPGEQKGMLPEDPKDRILIWVSIVGLVVVFYLLFFWESYSAFKGAKVVGILRTDRMVRRRHSRTLHWHDLKRQDTVFFQDIVYTPKDSQATVTFSDGRTLDLKPDSMVQFDELTVDGIQITLFDSGEKQKENREFFRLVPYPKVVKTNLLTDPGPLELRQSEFGDRIKKHMGEPVGLARLRKVGKVPFALDRLTDYQVVLLRPENQVFDIRVSRWIQALWTVIPLGSVKYELQMSQDDSFGEFVTHKAKSNQLVVQFENPGKYYWRIKAIRGDEVSYSKAGAFVMSRSNGVKSRMLTNERKK